MILVSTDNLAWSRSHLDFPDLDIRFTQDIYRRNLKEASGSIEQIRNYALALDFVTLARVDANVMLYGSFGFW